MGNSKAAVLGVSSILLVAAVVGAVTYGFSGRRSGTEGANPVANAQLATTSKAAESLCQHVDYKETCKQSLAGANSTDPKELIQHALNVGITTIGDVLSKSETIKNAQNDPMTTQAFEICKEVLNNAVFDFQRSIDKLGQFDLRNMDNYVADLKTWLSAANTVHSTCLEAFEGTLGDSATKMKQLLTTSGELAENGLAMVSDISKVFDALKIPGINRRLMSDEEELAISGRRLLEAIVNLKPNVTVAQDGSGQFKNIMDAVATIPPKNNQTYVILIKAGIYKEYVELPKKANRIVLIGEGPTKTKITGNKNYIDGVGTFKTSTLIVNGDNCILKDLWIENSAGAIKHQAVALRVSGDLTAIHNCQLDGYQDTLYAHAYRQFYRDTTITGTIDFIFGDAQSLFQNCKMVVRQPLEDQGCMVTAQGRKVARGLGAIVLQNCNIVADPLFVTAAAKTPKIQAFLGRPWKQYSRTIIMQSNIDGFINPVGFSEWNGSFALDTLYYAEYQNRGDGADTAHKDQRVKWPGIKHITADVAQSFTAVPYIQGDSWLPQTGIPFEGGMMKV